jgi:hypothetical protein
MSDNLPQPTLPHDRVQRAYFGFNTSWPSHKRDVLIKPSAYAKGNIARHVQLSTPVAGGNIEECQIWWYLAVGMRVRNDKTHTEETDRGGRRSHRENTSSSRYFGGAAEMTNNVKLELEKW